MSVVRTKFTQSDKEKLDSIEANYQGYYTSEAALIAAKPTGQAGWWAIVDPSGADNARIYAWDVDGGAWVDTGLSTIELIDNLTSTSTTAALTANQGKVLKDLIDALATVASTGDYDDLLNKPSLSAVATSGDYADLTNTPNFAHTIADEDNGITGWEAISWFAIDGLLDAIYSYKQKWRKTGLINVTFECRLIYDDTSPYADGAYTGEVYWTASDTKSSSGTYTATASATATPIPSEDVVPLRVEARRASGGDLTYVKNGKVIWT